MTFPTVVITGDQLPCPPQEHDQSYFLRVFDTSFPQDYLSPMQRNKNSGYEQFQSYALVGVRISLAVQRFWCGQYAMHASGPEFARGFVTFERPAGPLPALTIDVGSTVKTSDGRVYLTTAVATFLLGATTATPTDVPVIAIAAGYDYNREGEVITARGEVLPGEVNEIVNLYQTPPYADPTVTVKQVLPITGGVCGALDVLASNEGISRSTGEPDYSLRLRVRTLANTVTPNAIRQQIASYLDPYGIGWFFIEPWSLLYQTCWDAPSPNVGTPTYQVTPPQNLFYNPNLFYWDESAPLTPFRNYWLEPQDRRGAFVVFLQMPPEVSPGVFLYPSFASVAEQSAFMRGFVAMLNQIKAGGITVIYKVFR